MGKLKGFLETKREDKNKLDVKDRVKNYKDVYTEVSKEYIISQSSRCMECGVPFCSSGCPLGNNCPEWNDAAYIDNYKKAIDLLHETNNFPEFTGLVCPAPCEGSCVLGLNDNPVTIKNIEYGIAKEAWEKDYIKPFIIKNELDSKIAVIGSGPSGLAAAQELRRKGYKVTVFEKDSEVGGLLRYGIPDFKLEKDVVERRINQLKEEGIVFKTGINVGVDISSKELENEYDAILLACGSKEPRDLTIAGRELKGIHFAMDFLTQQNKLVSNESFNEEKITAKDKKVLVIGGGDTGSDCVGTSVRQGATNVVQIELLDRPSESRTNDNLWPLYPMTLKTSTSHEEAINVYNKEIRNWNISTKEFIHDEKGNVKGVKVVKIEVVNENGKISFKEVPNTEFIIDADLVLLAIGFNHTVHKGLVEDLKLELDNRGNVKDTDYQTNNKKYFVAGDMRRGQSLVVWAIKEGRDAAQKIHEYLKNDNNNKW